MQEKAVLEVLREIGAYKAPRVVVMNKVDPKTRDGSRNR